jgi:hypothetical protein
MGRGLRASQTGQSERHQNRHAATRNKAMIARVRGRSVHLSYYVHKVKWGFKAHGTRLHWPDTMKLQISRTFRGHRLGLDWIPGLAGGFSPEGLIDTSSNHPPANPSLDSGYPGCKYGPVQSLTAPLCKKVKLIEEGDAIIIKMRKSVTVCDEGTTTRRRRRVRASEALMAQRNK